MRTLLFPVILAVAALDANAATYLLLSQTNSFAAGITNIAKVYSDSLTNGTVASATNLAKAYTDAHSATPMVGTVSNAVASAGLLAVDSTKTNGIAATAAHIVSTLGFTPANSNSVPTVTAGTLVTNGASISAGDIVAYGSTLTNTAKATTANLQSALGQVYQPTNAVLTQTGTNSYTGTGLMPLKSVTDALLSIPFQTTLTHAGTTTLDLTPYWTEADLNSITGNVTVATTGLAAAHKYTLFGKNTQATNISISFPAGWANRFAGGSFSTVAPGVSFVLSINSRGTADTNCVLGISILQ